MTLNSKNTSFIYTIISVLIIICFIIWIIITQIEEYKLQDDPKLKELKKKVAPLFDKNIKYTGILSCINDRDVLNEVTLYKGDKSYTINKQKIFLCLKDEYNEYYDDMMLLHVLLHEICHSLCDEIGHTEKFNEMLDELLKKADEMQIYDLNYPVLQNYCQY